MTDLPTGTVTFLFTDLEVSTRLWEQEPDAMREALARHDLILRDAVAEHAGHVVKGTGDGIHAVFATADGAVGAAVDAQLALAAEQWAVSEPLRVRIGMHSGVAELREDDYFGSAVNRAARLMSVAHGGQVVCSQATADLARDSLLPGVALLDLGEHRLRDLSLPERVFQVDAPGLAREFAALASLDMLPGNVPSPTSSFVGREAELVALRDAVMGSRLVTLVGVGGVGKTRLVIRGTADLVADFTDGVWLCELAGADDAPSMHQLVAATLGIASRPGLDLRDSVAEFLGPKELLLVLDNCEHVIDAAAELAHLVIAKCPKVQVLATSREALALDGERIVRVGSLTLPEAGITSDWSASDAVRLFVERAADARAGFEVDKTNIGAIVELCRRLDGMPLALELAAARVASMTPAEIAGHLDERFRLLSGRRRATVERHRTLRAALDWSYSLLDDTERVVFDRVGVFAGGFTADAAVAVVADDIGPWDVLDALASLTAKSMLVADPANDGDTRYRMLETMRHYARERLVTEDDPEQWRGRHAEYYASLAREIGDALLGPDELAWRRRLAWELDDLRAAVNWSLDRPGDDRGVRIVAALHVQAAQYDSSGIGAWAQQCREPAEDAPAGVRTAVLGAAAWEAYRTADYPEAVALGEAALRDGLPRGWPSSYLPHVALAAGWAAQGRVDNSIAVAAAGHAALDAAGVSPVGHINLHCVQAGAADDHAQEHAEAALSLAQKFGNPTALAVGWLAVGMSCSVTDPRRALTAAHECIALIRDGAGDGVFIAALSLAALEATQLGDPEQALADLDEALRYGRDTGNRMAVASAVFAAARLFADLDRPVIAATLGGALAQSMSGATWAMAWAPRGAVIEELRTTLSSAEFDDAFGRGAEMSYDNVLQYLLTELTRVAADA
ncbi:MAG TPA: adenylate/guanylate cyclase domain-containing protein [Acidimicrobiia bacterium]|nr:adenylate/guanylate cyclase domain-containing protein [Acidimicrobiia bacterium]